MIYEINWDRKKPFPIPYMKDIPYFKRRNKVSFKRGLNILVGDNGCGKSTLINIIKFYFLEEHGNLPKFNVNEYDHLALYELSTGFPDGVNVVASYSTPTVSMNSVIKQSSSTRIDLELINFHLAKGSQGEMSMFEYNRCVNTMYNNNKAYKHPFALIESAMHKDWLHIDSIKAYYTKNDVKDRIPCMVMDEPDNSVSILHILDFQKELDELINNCSDGMQVIMVLHNPILLMHFIDNPKVNFIEMTKGYIDNIKKLKI